MSHEVVVTRSGARAMLDRATGEVMHPVIGPLAEADLLYLAPSRLAERLAEPGAPLVLFDVGLGAGSNAIAAWRLSEARASGRRLDIVSFDRTLSALDLALQGENAAAFGFEADAGAAARTLLASGRSDGPRTSWRLVLAELPVALDSEPAGGADIVFWDPFSPRANPSLWTVAAFTALRRVVADGATVHTYSAATATRAALLLAGFAVGLGDPVGEKEQTTMAAVRLADLPRPLDARWLDRLGRSSAPLPADAPSDAMARLRSLPQLGGSPEHQVSLTAPG
jgi:queuine tRNA-ribosyltransferase